MSKSYDQIALEMMQTGADVVELDLIRDRFILRHPSRPDLYIKRSEVEDNIHHQIIKEWAYGKAVTKEAS